MKLFVIIPAVCCRKVFKTERERERMVSCCIPYIVYLHGSIKFVMSYNFICSPHIQMTLVEACCSAMTEQMCVSAHGPLGFGFLTISVNKWFYLMVHSQERLPAFFLRKPMVPERGQDRALNWNACHWRASLKKRLCSGTMGTWKYAGPPTWTNLKVVRYE